MVGSAHLVLLGVAVNRSSQDKGKQRTALLSLRSPPPPLGVTLCLVLDVHGGVAMATAYKVHVGFVSAVEQMVR